MTINQHPTDLPELNDLLVELTARAQTILGDDFVGAYLQGSFAVGDADIHSDCDFIIVATTIAARPEAELRHLHDEIPTRDGHWCGHLEGSYAYARDLRDNRTIGSDWLYIDHGARDAEWSAHCNSAVARWSLHEHGITLAGPPPSDLVAEIPADLLRETMRRQLPGILDEFRRWLDIAWTQRYLVSTYCRTLYTLDTGRVTSKRKALLWAIDTLHPQWRPLLRQVLADRGGYDPTERPRPGSVDQALGFAGYAVTFAA